MKCWIGASEGKEIFFMYTDTHKAKGRLDTGVLRVRTCGLRGCAVFTAAE